MQDIVRQREDIVSRNDLTEDEKNEEVIKSTFIMDLFLCVIDFLVGEIRIRWVRD